jgi:hypothetical protein
VTEPAWRCPVCGAERRGSRWHGRDRDSLVVTVTHAESCPRPDLWLEPDDWFD